MTQLINIFNGHNDRAIHKWIHYMDIYERHFNEFVDTPVSILEIGVQRGGSLQMWKKYFGNKSKIIGVDIDPSTKFEEDQITVEIGSQSDEQFMIGINEKYGPFDIIIDDGSHHQHDVLTSFKILFPSLKMGGVYLVEDTHCSYFETHGGGLNLDTNFVNFAKRFVHEPTSEFILIDGEKKQSDVKSVSFYNSMVIFEKSSGEKTYSTFRGSGYNTDNVCLVP